MKGTYHVFWSRAFTPIQQVALLISNNWHLDHEEKKTSSRVIQAFYSLRIYHLFYSVSKWMDNYS